MVTPGELVTIVVPEIVPQRWWEHLLHNKTALYIRTAFLFRPNVVVTAVPYLLGHAYRLRDLFDHDEDDGRGSMVANDGGRVSPCAEPARERRRHERPLLCRCRNTRGAAVPAGRPRLLRRARAGTARRWTMSPFSFADFTWLNGTPRTRTRRWRRRTSPGSSGRTSATSRDFNHPKDHTLVGTSESGRTEEIQLQQLGIGGDFHYGQVRGRLMTQFGMYSTTTPRNDASTGRGQWDLADAYRYVSEAYGGYHWSALHGINVDAGIFMSYVGLFSYYNFDNWAYQPSYVSSNTPWFFNGMRLQLFPSDHLKIEPWLVNGWQSYGMFNEAPGLGLQVLWRPDGALSLLSNSYYGHDWLGIPDRWRVHSDNSLQVKYRERPASVVDRGAFSITAGRRVRARRRRELHGRVERAASPVLPRRHGLQPRLARARPVRGHARRRRDDQPRAIPRAHAAGQRRDGAVGHAVLHDESRATRSVPGTRRSRSTTCRTSSRRSASS